MVQVTGALAESTHHLEKVSLLMNQHCMPYGLAAARSGLTRCYEHQQCPICTIASQVAE